MQEAEGILLFSEIRSAARSEKEVGSVGFEERARACRGYWW